MAAINDNAGIFTGGTLEAFNQMQIYVARDGDVAYAQKLMLEAMQKVNGTTQLGTASSTGGAVKQRSR